MPRIGIFDSGVGGLTVQRAILETLPGLDTVYLGDTARVPYGTKSPEVVTQYSLHNARFLVRQGVDMVVVACNTASAVALDDLATLHRLPVVGVIEPGARRALEVTLNGRIGVIGTEGTIRSRAYERALQAGNPALEVCAAACPLFVPLAEEGWAEHPIARLAAAEYLTPLLREGIDTLVLGCTHYPLLKRTLQEVAGPDVTLIDSAEETAKTVSARLAALGLTRGNLPPGPPRYFVTDVAERFERVGGAFLGAPLAGVTTVTLD